MKIEARIFLWLTAFVWSTAIAYALWTYYAGMGGEGTHHHIEWAGTVALILAGGLLGICGTFFWFVARRIDARPEDRSDAEVAEAAGELGFFAPGSYWPAGIAASAALAAIGFAFVQIWLVVLAVFLILFTVGGLVFEYYVGGHRPASH
jgi:hypothetical protein